MDTARSLSRCLRCTFRQSPESILISPMRRRVVRTPFDAARTRSQRRQFSSSASTPAQERPSPQPSPPPAARPSIRDLLRDLKRHDEAKPQSISERMDALMGEKNQEAADDKGGRIDIANLLGPQRGIDQRRMLDEFSQEIQEAPPISLRLRPTLGRTVGNLYGEPAKGFRLLERKCNDNNVKQDARSQLFHVRRGQRRKDLNRLRWRKLFKAGFIAELDKIRRMKKQGW